MPSDLEVIEGLHDVYAEEPRRWVKGTLATDADARPVNPTSAQATCFCLRGGLRRYSADVGQRHRLANLITKFAPNHYDNEVHFNDSKKTDLDAVLHVLKSVALHLKHTS